MAGNAEVDRNPRSRCVGGYGDPIGADGGQESINMRPE